jgi:hypothetical protein
VSETRKQAPPEQKPVESRAPEQVLLPASESSDPDVHFALGNLQAARSGGNEQAIADAEAALAALGFN